MHHLLSQAVAFHRMGDLDAAEKIYRDILKAESKNPDALHLLGVVCRQHGDLDCALELLKKACFESPSNPLFISDWADALQDKKLFKEALACYARVLSIDPDNVQALVKSALALKNTGDFETALIFAQKALRIKPDFPQAHNAAGLVCAAREKYEEAIFYFREALRLDADFIEAYSNLGNAQSAAGDFNAAIVSFKEALRRNPDFFEAYYNMGNCLRETNNFDEAIVCYKAALRVKPLAAEALINLGEALQTIGNITEAESCCRKILALCDKKNVMTYAMAYSNLLLCMNYNPLYSPEQLHEEHCRFGKTFYSPQAGARRGAGYGKSRTKIRIGYVSPDFCMHPASRFIEPVLRFHDKTAFDIFCYSDAIRPDEISEKVRQLSTSWKDISHVSDDQVVDLIKSDKINLLVDLSGHTAHNRLLVFAKKPAPIQVSYLGYPNTTGISAIDYYLSDNMVDPMGHDRFYAEKLFRLENCFCAFMPYDNTLPVNELPAQKTGHITFGSLHTLTRLNSQVIDLWSGLLRTLASSRLCIVRNTLVGSVRERLYTEFEARGVHRSRIDMRNTLPLGGHLALFHDIDISLDTFPWSGHTTACESLWMGVPVVTLCGDRHAGRMVSSILTAAGLTDCIAQTHDEYIAIARSLASSQDALRDLRQGLRDRMAQSVLCDAKGFTKRLEEAYRKMVV
jgi:predicted O-linked N-acetylglucosamine transferase (SPINDLY family)